MQLQWHELTASLQPMLICVTMIWTRLHCYSLSLSALQCQPDNNNGYQLEMEKLRRETKRLVEVLGLAVLVTVINHFQQLTS